MTATLRDDFRTVPTSTKPVLRYADEPGLPASDPGLRRTSDAGLAVAKSSLSRAGACRPGATVMAVEIDTPLGRMIAVATDDGIAQLEFADTGRALPAAGEVWRAVAAPGDPASAHLSHLAQELAGYFDGHLTEFTVPVAASAGTPFQQAAWDYLRSIPFGQTRSYGQQAAALGAPAAARAVGGANGANPLCLLVPCHRVVGANGHLTGFAAGVHRKRWLLDHERAVIGEQTEPGRVGPRRATPASGAADAAVNGRRPGARRDVRSPRADMGRLCSGSPGGPPRCTSGVPTFNTGLFA